MMKKFATDIERSMGFLMSSDLKKSLRDHDAIQHLTRAKNLLDNAGLRSKGAIVSAIIKRANLIDESSIEVENV